MASLPGDRARAHVLLVARGMSSEEAADVVNLRRPIECAHAQAEVEVPDLLEWQALWELIDPRIRRDAEAWTKLLEETADRFLGDDDQNRLMVRAAVRRRLDPSEVGRERARVLKSWRQ